MIFADCLFLNKVHNKNAKYSTRDFVIDVGEKKYINNYMIILLFDKETSSIVKRFIKNYGEEINNLTGLDLPVFTIYDKETIESWNNAKEKQYLLSHDFDKYSTEAKRYEFMHLLAMHFNVKTFPALVFVKVNEGKDDLYNVIEFEKPTSYGIYRKIVKLNDAINKNYNDFKKICLDDVFQEVGKKVYYDTMLSDDFDEKFAECIKGYSFKTRADVAERIFGITYRRLQQGIAPLYPKKERKNKLKRDTIICIAIFLKKNKYRLNQYLLNEGYTEEFPKDRREEIILDLWEDGLNPIQIDYELREMGEYNLIGKKKTKGWDE